MMKHRDEGKVLSGLLLQSQDLRTKTRITSELQNCLKKGKSFWDPPKGSLSMTKASHSQHSQNQALKGKRDMSDPCKVSSPNSLLGTFSFPTFLAIISYPWKNLKSLPLQV